MAVVMAMEWAGATLEEYDRVMDALQLDAQAPTGGIFHVCGAEGGTLRIFDVWESEEAWNDFRDNRLMPALEQTGLVEKGQPDVKVYPVHNAYLPDASALTRVAGSSSLAGTPA